LPSIFGPPEQRKRQALDTMALLLVHGTPIGRVGSFDAELLAAVWKAQAAFGIDQATFHGYWQNADRLKLSPTHDRVVASLYERDGRRMIIVSNFTPEPRPVSLELTSPPAAHTLKDPLSGETYPSANGRFTLTIAPHSFRLMLTGDK